MNKTYGEVATEIFSVLQATEIKPKGKADVLRLVERNIELQVARMFPEARVLTCFRNLSATLKDRYFSITFSEADTLGGIYFNYEVSLTMASRGYSGATYGIKSIQFKADDYDYDLTKTMAELAQAQIDKSGAFAKNSEADLDAQIEKAEKTFPTLIEKMKKREPLTWEESYVIESLFKRFKELKR